MTTACTFYVRTAVDGGFHFRRVEHGTPDGRLYVNDPPAVGDCISLGATSYRVIYKEWGIGLICALFSSPLWPALAQFDDATYVVDDEETES